MDSHLKFELLSRDLRTQVNLIGKIDETADFSSLDLRSPKEVIFDFAEVKMINSVGIQRWVTFLFSIPLDKKIFFRRCPLRIVNQINLFPDFTANRPVHFLSFYAPYYCEQCEVADSILLTTKDHFPKGRPLTIPLRDCVQCQNPMSFGGIEEKYLLFLKRQRQQSAPKLQKESA